MGVTLKRVDIDNGETIAYRERSGGQIPLFLLHSNLVSTKHWDLLFESLDSDYKIYGVDMRGFGDSSYRNRITSIDDLANDVRLFIDELGISQCHVLGWSTGGAVAMQLTASNPATVVKLILLNPVPTREMYPVYETDESGDPIPKKPLLDRDAIERHPQVKMLENAQRNNKYDKLREFWNEAVYVNQKPESDRYRKYLEDMCTQRNLADVRYAVANFNISDVDDGHTEGTGKVKAINHPTLILTGELDEVISSELLEKTKRDIGENAKLGELIGCGHNPMIDDIEQTTTAIEEFLQKGST
jgi:pimeloyl-ACP methyl ester carboxylesterase